jgi:hypothetical protein
MNVRKKFSRSGKQHERDEAGMGGDGGASVADGAVQIFFEENNEGG